MSISTQVTVDYKQIWLLLYMCLKSTIFATFRLWPKILIFLAFLLRASAKVLQKGIVGVLN